VIIHDSPFDDVPLRNCSITECVFDGLKRAPTAVVLIDGPTGRTVTAGQLMDDIRSVAGGLDSLGAGTGRTVALMAPNSPEYCTIFHAVAWAGGTITTVNPAYTASEVRHQLDDAGADWLITTSEAEATARTATKGTDTGLIVLGDDTDPVADLRGVPIESQVPVNLDNHVVVLPYSSGTTGLPKGVMLSHRNLVVNVDQILAVADIDPGEITPVFRPFVSPLRLPGIGFHLRCACWL
jgi:4-coumarate--CoA ligase